MLQFLTQSSWADRIGWVLVHSLWQFAIVALAAFLVHRILARRSAASRYGVLLAAMACTVASPIATWFSPWAAETPRGAVRPQPVEEGQKPFTMEIDPRRPGYVRQEPAPMMDSPSAPLAASATPPVEPPRTEPERPSLAAMFAALPGRVQPWLPQVVLVWLAGVVLAAVRPLWSWITVCRLRAVGVSAVPDTVPAVLERMARAMKLRRTVKVLQSALVKTPVVIGYLRPAVLLPFCVVTGLPEPQLELILAHELAHVRRHDYLVNLLQTLAETLFFYHPAVWWLSRQIRNERENCCDDLAMAVAGSRADYGRALLAIEELRAASPAFSLAAGGGSLLARIRRIAGREPSPRVVGGGSILGVILVCLVIAVAATWGAAEPPAAATAEGNSKAKDTAKPLGPTTALAHKEYWSLTLKETRQFALQNAKVMLPSGALVQRWRKLPVSSPAAAPAASESAAPTAIPGSNQGVLIARANTDISLFDFETKIRDLVSDVETAYWELHFAYRNLDAAMQGRDSALQLWQKVYKTSGASDDKASAEAQARQQYFLFKGRAEQALAQLYQAESKLRYMMGIAAVDGRLIRPTDEPTTAKITFDWSQVQREALSRSPEIREARWRVKQRELELTAAKKYTLPSAEAQVPLAARKQKDGITNAELALARDRARLRETELEVSHELLYAIRDMDANRVLTETNFNRRLASQRNLEAVKTSFENGRIGIKVVLDVQRSLLQAESDYFRSLTNYMKSISQVHFRKGSLLEHNGIDLSNLAVPPTTNNQSGKTFAAKPAAEVWSASDPSATKEGAKAEGQIIFAGLCRDQQGRAVADAQVSLLLSDYEALSDKRLQSIRTDQAGQFRFEPIASFPAGPFKFYWISAKAKGLVAGVRRPSAPRSQDPEHLQIAMSEAASVRGKITGPDGRPVEGARVWIGTVGPIDGINSATSNAEGFFEVSDLDKYDGKPVPIPGHPAAFAHFDSSLLVRHPRFAEAIVGVQRVPSTINVTLKPSASIQGCVVCGDSDKPAAGVHLSARAIPVRYQAEGEAITDSQGRYHFDALTAGKYNIYTPFHRDGYTMAALESIEATAGTMKTAPDLRLVHGGLIVGRLIDDETGKPFRPATLDPSWDRPDIVMYGPSRPRSGGACEGASIQEDGSFQLRAAPGDNEVYMRSETPRPLPGVNTITLESCFEEVSPLAFHLDVAEGQTVTIEFKVRKKAAAETEPSNRQEETQPAKRPPNGPSNIAEATDLTGVPLAAKPAAEGTGNQPQCRAMQEPQAHDEELERMRRAKNEILAALSPQQREKLRSEVVQTAGKVEERLLSYRDWPGQDEEGRLPDSLLALVADWSSAGGDRWSSLVLPFYWELTETAIARQLGVSAEQQKQLAGVAAGHHAERMSFIRGWMKLPLEQRKRPELQQKALRMLEATRRRTEAVLTPKQLAELKEAIFRRRAFGILTDATVQARVGLTDQQKVAVERVHEDDMNHRDPFFVLDPARKSFDLLTPQQQEKLRVEVERQGW